MPWRNYLQMCNENNTGESLSVSVLKEVTGKITAKSTVPEAHQDSGNSLKTRINKAAKLRDFTTRSSITCELNRKNRAIGNT